MTPLTHAMVLAAGLGTRMRPLTDDRPKPLLELGGRSLLDHALDRLEAAGVSHAVVNAHWHGDQIVAAMKRRADPVIALQEEAELLETGGSIQRALPRLGDQPFAVVNGDAFWLDGPTPALQRLATAFDPERMDGLLLMVRTTQVEGMVARGDFLLDPMGRLRRPKEREIAPYLYAGVQILAPSLFAGVEPGHFSLNRLYDRAIEAGRLYGFVHDGVWFHISTPGDLRHADRLLQSGLARVLF